MDELKNRYVKSLMHKETVSHVLFIVPPHAEHPLLITASIDGVIKFWQRTLLLPKEGKIEDLVPLKFIKSFQTHTGPLISLRKSMKSERYLIASGVDGMVTIYDCESIDLLSVYKFDFLIESPLIIENILGDVVYLGLRDEPLILKTDLNFSQVTEISIPKSIFYIDYLDDYLIVFCEEMITLYKNDSLIQQIKCSECKNVTNITVGFSFIAILDEERTLSIFKTKRTNKEIIFKLYRKYNLSNSSPNEAALLDSAYISFNNVLFDETEENVIVAEQGGVKMINIKDSKASFISGAGEEERFINISIINLPFQLQIDPNLIGNENFIKPQPLLAATAFKKDRFYLFNNQTITNLDKRDIYNEQAATKGLAHNSKIYQEWEGIKKAIIRTFKGDIEVELFHKESPLAVQNFITLMMNGYYCNMLFHRVIRGFMIQTGDPLGTGAGGTSCWGKSFKDEFSPKLKHNQPGTLSMANCGPNTNGSQFFITSVATPWLDGKHTIFGRVAKGMDVVRLIESVEVDRQSKPLQPVYLMQIEPFTSN